MQTVQRTTETTAVDTTGATTNAATAAPSGTSVAIRLVYFILGIIETILAFRLILALLGANPANGFANFVYSISEPLARPFFSLFSYQPAQGISRLEIGTIVAMLVYAVIAWGIVALLRLPRRAKAEDTTV